MRQDVVFVSMPFGPVFSPSFALSLLKAELAQHGIASRVRYFSIRFAEATGEAFYSRIAVDGSPSIRELVGEWIFSGDLFAQSAQDEAVYVDEILRRRAAWAERSRPRPISEALIGRILGARRKVGAFLDACVEELVREQPRLVGFTSIFQQHVASLALAKRLKAALPETFVVFGGANCEHVMGAETVRQFPFVDAVVSGEADLVFPDLVRRVLDGRSVAGLPGVRTLETVAQDFATGQFSTAPTVQDLDALPYPDFEDYFEQFRASRFGRDWQPGLFFESSRGCWWGEKLHCTFCGLNGQTMAYRSKSARRALDEIVQLAAKYPGCDIQVVDNILDMSYFKDLVPQLAERRLGLDLFYETKANLKKEQVRLLRTARITRIQPGIESFSSQVLGLMRKGVSGLQNIQLLKWCKELGVEPYWNVLFGFPGESALEYERMARLVPLLTHLPAPVGMGGIRLDRFSPNFFDADKLGFVDVEPLAPYRHVYCLPPEALANLAYYFTYRYREPRDVDAYAGPFLRQVAAWKRVHRRSDLFAVEVGARLLLWDLRPAAASPLTVLTGIDRLLYQGCDAASDLQQLAQLARAGGYLDATRDQLEARLQPLLERGLLLQEGPRYLALAVPLGEYKPKREIVERFYDVASALAAPGGRGLRVPLDGVDGRLSRPKLVRNLGGSRRPASRGNRRSLSTRQFSVNKRGDLVIR